MRETPDQIQNRIINEINASGDVFSQYSYLLEMATRLPAMSDDDKKRCSLVDGCQSQVWLRGWEENGRIYYQASSDTLIVRGLLFLILQIYSGAFPSEIEESPLRFLTETELADTLESSRRDGVTAMIRSVVAIAHQYAH